MRHLVCAPAEARVCRVDLQPAGTSVVNASDLLVAVPLAAVALALAVEEPAQARAGSEDDSRPHPEERTFEVRWQWRPAVGAGPSPGPGLTIRPPLPRRGPSYAEAGIASTTPRSSSSRTIRVVSPCVSRTARPTRTSVATARTAPVGTATVLPSRDDCDQLPSVSIAGPLLVRAGNCLDLIPTVFASPGAPVPRRAPPPRSRGGGRRGTGCCGYAELLRRADAPMDRDESKDLVRINGPESAPPAGRPSRGVRGSQGPTYGARAAAPCAAMVLTGT